jgi:hypothetical protein
MKNNLTCTVYPCNAIFIDCMHANAWGNSIELTIQKSLRAVYFKMRVKEKYLCTVCGRENLCICVKKEYPLSPMCRGRTKVS